MKDRTRVEIKNSASHHMQNMCKNGFSTTTAATVHWLMDEMFDLGIKSVAPKESSGICESPLEFAAKVIIENAKEKGYIFAYIGKKEVVFIRDFKDMPPISESWGFGLDHESAASFLKDSIEGCLTIRCEGDE